MLMGAAHCNTSENSMSSSWDQFGDSLAESIAKAEAIRGRRKCLKAWNALLSFIVSAYMFFQSFTLFQELIDLLIKCHCLK